MAGTADDTIVREAPAWITLTLDIAACARLEIVVPLFDEFETAGVMFETWPAPVRSQALKAIREFGERHATREIAAVTHGLHRSEGRVNCITIVHWRDKAK